MNTNLNEEEMGVGARGVVLGAVHFNVSLRYRLGEELPEEGE